MDEGMLMEKVKKSKSLFSYFRFRYITTGSTATNMNPGHIKTYIKKKKRTRRVFSENVLTEKQVMTEETASSIRLLCIRSVFIKSSWKKDPMDKNLTHTR